MAAYFSALALTPVGSPAQAAIPVATVSRKAPLVLDVDTGRDDAWTILGAIDELRVRAIVSTYGNAPLPLTTKNTLDVVALAQRELHDIKIPLAAIPVWRGEDQPMAPQSPIGLAEIQRRAQVNGNGLNNVELPAGSETAHEGLEAFAQYLSHGPKVDYLVCGPLTNLARLIDQFAIGGDAGAIKKHIRRVIVMGGSFDPALPVDFNFKADPTAAQKVIALFGRDLILVPFDETKKLLLTEADILALKPQDTAAAFSRDLMLAHARGWSSDHTIMLHDPTTLLVENEKVQTRFEKVSIIQDGPQAGKAVDDAAGTTVRRLVIEDKKVKPLRDKLLDKYLNLTP